MFDQSTLNNVWKSASASRPQVATQTTPKKSSGGLGGFLHAVVSPAAYFLNTDIINPTKEVAATLTGNKTAMKNAENAQSKTIGATPGEAFKRLAGNTVGLAATTIAPEAKVGLGAKVLQGAKVGAAAGAGNAAANDQSIVKGASLGAVTGGATNGILSKIFEGKPLNGSSDANAVTAAKQANGLRNPLASAGAQARKYGTDLLANKLNIDEASAIKFKGPQTVATLQKDYGLTPHQAALLHPIITGSDGKSTEALDSALEGMGKVNFSDFGTKMRQELQDPEFLSGNDLSPSQKKNLNDLVQQYHGALNPDTDENFIGQNGKISANIGGSGTNAKAAMDVARKLEKSGYENQATSDVTKNAKGDTELKMADFIKSRIYNAPGGEDALTAAKDMAASSLNDIAQQSGNAKLAKVAQAFQTAPDFQSYRAISSPFVNAKQLVDKSNIRDFANKGQNSGGGLFNTLKTGASKVVSPAGGKILSNIGNKLDNLPNASAPAQVTQSAASNVLSRLRGTPLTAGATREATVGSTGLIPNNGSSQQDEGALSTDQLQKLQTDLTPDTAISNSSSEPASDTTGFDKNTLLALIAADPTNAATYMSLYKIVGTDLNSASQNATALKNEQTAEQSQNALNSIESAFNAAGGGKGKVSGAFGNLEAKLGLNSNVATYNDTATALGAQIYKALGNTGTISDQDQRLIANLIPKTTDTAKTAQEKISQLQSLLQNAQQIAAQGATQ